MIALSGLAARIDICLAFAFHMEKSPSPGMQRSLFLSFFFFLLLLDFSASEQNRAKAGRADG